jgi:hypothetical protein
MSRLLEFIDNLDDLLPDGAKHILDEMEAHIEAEDHAQQSRVSALESNIAELREGLDTARGQLKTAGCAVVELQAVHEELRAMASYARQQETMADHLSKRMAALEANSQAVASSQRQAVARRRRGQKRRGTSVAGEESSERDEESDGGDFCDDRGAADADDDAIDGGGEREGSGDSAAVHCPVHADGRSSTWQVRGSTAPLAAPMQETMVEVRRLTIEVARHTNERRGMRAHVEELEDMIENLEDQKNRHAHIANELRHEAAVSAAGYSKERKQWAARERGLQARHLAISRAVRRIAHGAPVNAASGRGGDEQEWRESSETPASGPGPVIGGAICKRRCKAVLAGLIELEGLLAQGGVDATDGTDARDGTIEAQPATHEGNETRLELIAAGEEIAGLEGQVTRLTEALRETEKRFVMDATRSRAIARHQSIQRRSLKSKKGGLGAAGGVVDGSQLSPMSSSGASTDGTYEVRRAAPPHLSPPPSPGKALFNRVISEIEEDDDQDLIHEHAGRRRGNFGALGGLPPPQFPRSTRTAHGSGGGWGNSSQQRGMCTSSVTVGDSNEGPERGASGREVRSNKSAELGNGGWVGHGTHLDGLVKGPQSSRVSPINSPARRGGEHCDSDENTADEARAAITLQGQMESIRQESSRLQLLCAAQRGSYEGRIAALEQALAAARGGMALEVAVSEEGATMAEAGGQGGIRTGLQVGQAAPKLMPLTPVELEGCLNNIHPLGSAPEGQRVALKVPPEDAAACPAGGLAESWGSIGPKTSLPPPPAQPSLGQCWGMRPHAAAVRPPPNSPGRGTASTCNRHTRHKGHLGDGGMSTASGNASSSSSGSSRDGGYDTSTEKSQNSSGPLRAVPAVAATSRRYGGTSGAAQAAAGLSSHPKQRRRAVPPPRGIVPAFSERPATSSFDIAGLQGAPGSSAGFGRTIQVRAKSEAQQIS